MISVLTNIARYDDCGREKWFEKKRITVTEFERSGAADQLRVRLAKLRPEGPGLWVTFTSGAARHAAILWLRKQCYRITGYLPRLRQIEHDALAIWLVGMYS